MVDPKSAGVSDSVWREAIAHCHELRVARKIEETHDSVSIVLEIPSELREAFAYRAGQFLSFKIPYRGKVLTRSYSLASCPDTDSEHKVTIKRVDGGRISNWMNDEVRTGTSLMVVPPAGLFVLDPRETRDVMLFAGGSGITPCISIIKTALAATARRCSLVYANRDARSIIFRSELEALQGKYGDRLEIVHSLDDDHGFLSGEDVALRVAGATDRDFYLCGPSAFMDTVENALFGLDVPRRQIHIERFLSPPDHHEEPATAGTPAGGEKAPASIKVVLDGKEVDIDYTPNEKVLEAARRAGLDPPFSCEEGYCSCCMAKLLSGQVAMSVNDCLTPDLLAEGWVLTCQARCISDDVKVEYPD
jgi:3-ketosteroid 9alpha-monooxygenase subunit B